MYAASAIIAAISCGVHPKRLDLAASDLPTPLQELLIQHLSTTPQDRPDSAEQWKDQLLTVLAATTSEPQALEVDSGTEGGSEVSAGRLDSQLPQPVTTSSTSTPPSSTPPLPPANSWGPESQSGGSVAPAWPASTSTPANVPTGPQTFTQAQQFTPNLHTRKSATTWPTTSTSGVAHALERGAIALITSFVLLYALAVVVFEVEGEAGQAFQLAVGLAVFGPVVVGLLGIRYLPWPRPKP